MVQLTHFLNEAFHHASAFNSDLTGWDIAKVESFQKMFFNAIRFNFKRNLEETWSSNSFYPGYSMFNGTCSEDRESGGTCGTCGDQTSAEEDHVVACGTQQGGRLPLTTNCTFCADYGDECCMPFAAADGTIHDAVSAWLEDEVSARQTYGDISMWDTSEVTDMSDLFCAHDNCGNNKKSAAASFNGNLSGWDVGKVSDMHSSK